jgi:hypothetical protein
MLRVYAHNDSENEQRNYHMNRIQKLSLKILAERLKLQLGLDPGADVDYRTLRAMNHQLCAERLLELARAEASYLSVGS